MIIIVSWLQLPVEGSACTCVQRVSARFRACDALFLLLTFDQWLLLLLLLLLLLMMMMLLSFDGNIAAAAAYTWSMTADGDDDAATVKRYFEYGCVMAEIFWIYVCYDWHSQNICLRPPYSTWQPRGLCCRNKCICCSSSKLLLSFAFATVLCIYHIMLNCSATVFSEKTNALLFWNCLFPLSALLSFARTNKSGGAQSQIFGNISHLSPDQDGRIALKAVNTL